MAKMSTIVEGPEYSLFVAGPDAVDSFAILSSVSFVWTSEPIAGPFEILFDELEAEPSSL